MNGQAEANLKALIESTQDFIWSVDLDFRLLTFNRVLKQDIEASFGTRAETGKSLADLYPPEIAARWLTLYERALSGGPFQVEYQFVSGQILDVTLNPIIVDGKQVGVSGFGKDITKRRAAENALKEAENKYQEIYTGALEGILQTSSNGAVLTANPSVARILGYDSPEEFASRVKYIQHDVLSDPNDRARYLKQIEEHGVLQGFECKFKRKDGSPVWVSLNIHKKYSSSAKQFVFEGFIEDITERKKSEDLLRESLELLKEAQVIGALGSYVLDISADKWTSSDVLDGLLGIDKEYDRTVQGWVSLIHPADRSMMYAYFTDEVAGHGITFDKEYRIARHSDGVTRWVHGLGRLEFNPSGQPYKMRGVIRDITERKKSEFRIRESEERYRLAFQTNLDIMVISRVEDGRLVDVNDTFCYVTGFTREEAIGKTELDLNIWINPGDRQLMVEALQQSSSFRDVEVQFRKKDGEAFWGQVSVSLVELNGACCVISATRDISAAKAAKEELIATQQALAVSEAHFRTIFQTCPDFISVSRVSNGTYLEVNDAIREVMGYERHEVIGRTSVELNIWAEPNDRQNFVQVLHQTGECHNLEVNFRRKSGEVFVGLVSASIVEIEGIPCIILLTRDISDAKNAAKQLRDLAFYDPLTRLPNRRLLFDRLQSTLKTHNGRARTKALLFIDLYDFKTLNETRGMQTGDLMLVAVSHRIVGCVRAFDTVARFGGDKFAAILEDLSPDAEEAPFEARKIAEEISRAISEPYLLAGFELQAASSIGITVFDADSQDPNEVLNRAEIAMYQAKAEDRNLIRFYAPLLQNVVNARAVMQEELRRGIRNSEFVLCYQPQVENGKLIGAEALIRWNHPTRGLLPPGDFISFAEETGLIIPLGAWVLDAACRQIASLAEQKYAAQIQFAINISARQFRQPNFVDEVLATLERTGANPQNLKLELTESLLVQDIEDVIVKMTALKEHGLHFSLDDFGTGYSSLSYLKRLPLDQLKIDRAFVRDILSDAASGAIAQTIISLGKAMGLSVIAEGVETEEQREFLCSLGCHSFQGYLFSRPLPLEEFERLCKGGCAPIAE